ncbi:hypothetical protein GVO57_09865 [Sphingomonas changnyeongensis]|uniref:Uncharacterized protein n=1 Tax=Sphingomonas changnyeongensis TaxID=2698679 RepID=A0A7Z2NWD7_9SPHN|nr:hypothetical protein [Sphingomonas changnyeongensis]QHL91068.1 hypothetical protein GVO57_09865 [Sphingomonas changnyeongensis]
MLKEIIASNTAKLIAACVCPVVGTAAVTMGVPKVRQAVHRATAPAQPTRTARAKPRVRTPAQAAVTPVGAGIICPDPVVITSNPLVTPFANPIAPVASAPVRPDQVSFALPNRPFFPGGPNPGLFPGSPPPEGGDPTNPPPPAPPPRRASISRRPFQSLRPGRR